MAQQVTVRLVGRPQTVTVSSSTAAGAAPDAADAAAEIEHVRQQMRQEIDAERLRVAQSCRALAAAAEQFDRLQDELLAEAETQLVDLAIDIARKVLMQEIQAERYEIDPIVAEALRRVPCRRGVVVHLHGDDLARCRAAEQLAEDSEHIRFVADPNVRPGECVVQTPEGVVESSVASHLEDVAEQLRASE